MNRKQEDGCVVSITSIIVSFLKVWLIMLLWNALMPYIFSVLPTLTYWQAFGVYILCHLLFVQNTSVNCYLQDINDKLYKL